MTVMLVTAYSKTEASAYIKLALTEPIEQTAKLLDSLEINPNVIKDEEGD